MTSISVSCFLAREWSLRRGTWKEFASVKGNITMKEKRLTLVDLMEYDHTKSTVCFPVTCYSRRLMRASPEEVPARIEKLRSELEKHNHRYYILDDPSISDAEYDLKFRELVDLETSHPHLISPDSPTQRIGAKPSTKFKKVAHRAPMLSLANAFSGEDLLDFSGRITRILGESSIDFVSELKIDGAAVSLTYQEGLLSVGATRGDGRFGEDVTDNLRTIRTIPLRLKGSLRIPDLVEVRGEAYLPLSAFQAMNIDREAKGRTAFANPRNAAAGALRQLKATVTARRPLAFFPYAIGYLEGFEISTQWEALELLEQWGFRVNLHCRRHGSMNRVIEYCREYESRRQEMDYEFDGVVVKVDRLDYQRRLGSVARDPRWAMAFKFPSEVAVTRLQKIGINVGRTGALNPYAILEAVQVGGVTVRQATLHNEDDIRKKDIRAGDLVRVKRAGDVIPQVVGPVISQRTGTEKKFRYPTTCPKCSSEIVRLQDEATVYCPNASCPAQRLEKLKHFVSRGAMDIRGLGQQTIKKMINAHLIADAGDLYSLTADQISDLPGFTREGPGSADKGKSTRNLLSSLQESKGEPFTRVLFALGIRHVGEGIARLLVQHFRSIDSLSNADFKEIAMVHGIGPEIAGSVQAYLDQPSNLLFIGKLREAGLKLRTDGSVSAERLLEGKTFVITGTLPGLSRREAKEAIQRRGGKVTASVSSVTTYVVVGDKPGLKVGKARELGVETINEVGLRGLLQDVGGDLFGRFE